MELKRARNEEKLTQKEVAKILNVSLRTYQYYETNGNLNQRKKEQILTSIHDYKYKQYKILTLDQIKELTTVIFTKYNINHCQLFGDYATKRVNEYSAIKFLISDLSPKYELYKFIYDLRKVLNKNVEVLEMSKASKNIEKFNGIVNYAITII